MLVTEGQSGPTTRPVFAKAKAKQVNIKCTIYNHFQSKIFTITIWAAIQDNLSSRFPTK